MRRGWLFIIMLLASLPARAEFFEFHTSNLQLLHGSGYKLGPKERTIVTFEHYNRWHYGDFFMFLDATRFDGGHDTFFTELSPRISLSKTTGRDWSFGPVKDLYLAGTYEKGRHQVEAFLYGLGTDIDLPGFQVFRVDGYVRDNPMIAGTGWQTTLVWKKTFEWQEQSWVFEGFADIATDEGDRYVANQFVVPRLLMDVGKLAGQQEDRLYAGIEWQYWHNKFGVDGATESVPQFQVKWVFD